MEVGGRDPGTKTRPVCPRVCPLLWVCVTARGIREETCWCHSGCSSHRLTPFVMLWAMCSEPHLPAASFGDPPCTSAVSGLFPKLGLARSAEESPASERLKTLPAEHTTRHHLRGERRSFDFMRDVRDDASWLRQGT